MTLDRPALQRKVNDLYRREHEGLGEVGARHMLQEMERARQEVAAGGSPSHHMGDPGARSPLPRGVAG